MTAEACRVALEAANENERAPALDRAFPRCSCERWALTAQGGLGVRSDERLARVLTSPDAYSEATSTIITQKLTSIYSVGLSVIRQGASDDEIIGTVNDLLAGGEEQRVLVGAIVVGAEMLRAYIEENVRWFGVYATDDRGKTHHVDLLGTTPSGSNSAVRRIKTSRRYKLAEDLEPFVLLQPNLPDLISALRVAGI